MKDEGINVYSNAVVCRTKNKRITVRKVGVNNIIVFDIIDGRNDVRCIMEPLKNKGDQLTLALSKEGIKNLRDCLTLYLMNADL